jgi:excisionase family DNA binding protein
MEHMMLLADAELTYLDVAQVAKLMNSPEATVRKWGKSGLYGAVKKGHHYYFPQEKLDMLSVDDVAAWLNLNVQTVRRWAREGTYNAVKIGRRYYFSRSELMTETLTEA